MRPERSAAVFRIRRGSTRPQPHHRPRLRAGAASSLDDEMVRALSDLFRLLGEPTRLRILHALAGGELCVHDLADGLGMSDSAISHQLRLLRALRLVRNRRDGREVYYALDDDHVVHLMGDVLSHLQHGRRTAL